jgi:hypothetical protein
MCMPTELTAEVFDSVVTTVNFVKSSATNSRLFHHLCQDAVHERLLFFDSVRWLSLECNVFFELKEELAMYLTSKGQRLAEGYFRNKLAKLAYLTDILMALNVLNKSLLQGQKNEHFRCFWQDKGILWKVQLPCKGR